MKKQTGSRWKTRLAVTIVVNAFLYIAAPELLDSYVVDPGGKQFEEFTIIVIGSYGWNMFVALTHRDIRERIVGWIALLSTGIFTYAMMF